MFSDLAITTSLIVKQIFSMPSRGLSEFISFILKLTELPLSYPHYSCISKQAKMVNSRSRLRLTEPFSS
ncbi:Mobile element protein [Candidatus Enterovibrio altilux]|uniref:Mobile element protein n=1 Tax=Candidatus Enterovibrio altilux TaxID=1927128 RepID=A0A291BAD7_9GAMM|nr:Mobile element protein [Candidatus Enterovibrio luxaltus]